MRIIPRRIIKEWYDSEYSMKKDGSIYGRFPESLRAFFNILKNNSLKEVLELGCGDGRNIIEFAKRGYRCTGVDFSGKDSCNYRAKKLGLNIAFIEQDITTFDFKKNRYDVIISSDVFHLLERKKVEEIIDKMKIATKERGHIYISILSNLKRVFMDTREEFMYEGEANYNSGESEELLGEKFRDWKIFFIDTFKDEQEWPLEKSNRSLPSYHWVGEYVYIIAQKNIF